MSKQELKWKVHTAALLQEIAHGSGQAIYHIPLSILGKLIAAVGERAAEINDPRLNELMVRMTVYTIADPYSPDYDPKRVAEILKEDK